MGKKKIFLFVNNMDNALCYWDQNIDLLREKVAEFFVEMDDFHIELLKYLKSHENQRIIG